MEMITVYVLKGQNGKRYVGITNDLERRLHEHRTGRTKGGQIIGSFDLLLTECYEDYTQARCREKFLKAGQGREWLNSIDTRTRPASGG
jgi:putative endonuclease